MNDMTLLNGKNLPTHAQSSGGGSNLASDMGGAGWPRLTFKGNRFRVNIGGDERVLGTMNLKLVILEANPHVSRVYYARAYDGENFGRPDCASADGVTPLAGVPEPQSKTCATCPMNEKGSAITDTGGKTRACSFYKRVTVLLVDEPELGPLVTDMKAMTMFGKSAPDKGLFSLRDYAKRLDQNKVMPYAVVTEATFDSDESVPKVLFKAVDFTSSAFHNKYVDPLLVSGELERMVSTSDIPTSEEVTKPTPPQTSGFRDPLNKPKPSHAENVEKHGTDTPEEKQPPAEEELTPGKKSARTRAKKKEAEKVAQVKAADTAEQQMAEAAGEEVEGTEMVFDDALEDALSEFGF